jgi:hypothetical protein
MLQAGAARAQVEWPRLARLSAAQSYDDKTPMLRSPIVILVLGGLSLYHTDLGSELVWRSLVPPLLVFVLLVALAVWLVLFFTSSRYRSEREPGRRWRRGG